MEMNIGFSLTGGGARGAYQAGVVTGLATIIMDRGEANNLSPFNVLWDERRGH